MSTKMTHSPSVLFRVLFFKELFARVWKISYLCSGFKRQSLSSENRLFSCQEMKLKNPMRARIKETKFSASKPALLLPGTEALGFKNREVRP